MIAAWLAVAVLAAASGDDRGFVVALHNDSQVLQVQATRLQPGFSADGYDTEELPTGETYQIGNESSLFLQLERPVDHAGGVTLKPCRHVIALACRLWAGGDFLMGYDTQARRWRWQIPMEENVFGFHAVLSWYRDRYVVLRRDGHMDGCFAIFDTFRRRQVFFQHWKSGDDYDFDLTPAAITIHAPGGMRTVPF